MRIWSLHPKYLDAKGLVALWRETLLAKHVLEGKTKGFTRHPQLNRFRLSDNPLDSINQYLSEVYHEAENRNYCFDRQKVDWSFKRCTLKVTTGQMNFEKSHLLQKLEIRDNDRFKMLKPIKVFESHPLFELIDGETEEWEITPGNSRKADSKQ